MPEVEKVLGTHDWCAADPGRWRHGVLNPGLPLRLLRALASIACLMGSSGCGRVTEKRPVALAPIVAVRLLDRAARSSEETERLLTVPVERALHGLPGARTVRSLSIAGEAHVVVTLAPGADVFAARHEAAARLMGLAEGVAPELLPVVEPGEPFRYVLIGDGARDPVELRALEDWVVRTKLLAIPGVADVAACGGAVAEVHVDVDPARLAAAGLGLGQLRDAFDRADGPRQLEDIGDLVVASVGGVPVRLADLAIVRRAAARPTCAALLDGVPVVGGVVLASPGGDRARLARELTAALGSMQPGLPSGVRLRAFPGEPSGEVLRISIRTTSDAPWNERLRIERTVAGWLRERAEVASVLAEIGRPDGTAPDPFAADLEIHVLLRPRSAWPQAASPTGFEREVRAHLAGLPGVLASGANGRRTRVVVAIRGPEIEVLAEVAQAVRQAVALPDVDAVWEEGTRRARHVEVVLDRSALARHGLGASDVELVLAAAGDGVRVAALVERDRRVDIVLRIGAPGDLASSGSLLVGGSAGAVPLSQVAQLLARETPSLILRRDGQREVLLRLELREAARTVVMRELRARLAEVRLPPGYLLAIDEE